MTTDEARHDSDAVWLDVAATNSTPAHVPLSASAPRLTIGRDPAADIALIDDPAVSRLHAVIELIGSAWTIADHGVSTNGTFVNGERIFGRRRLFAGDHIEIGDTELTFGAPDTAGVRTNEGEVRGLRITAAQLAVVRELCRPFKDNPKFASPATNAEIAVRLGVTAETVAKHLQALYERFDVVGLPQNRKRATLVYRAMAAGIREELGL